MKSHSVSRRHFLQSSAVASAPFILPSGIWSAKVKPNDKYVSEDRDWSRFLQVACEEAIETLDDPEHSARGDGYVYALRVAMGAVQWVVCSVCGAGAGRNLLW